MADRKWKKFLVIYSAALLIFGLIGCILLYRYCGVFEITRPEICMNKIMQTMSVDDFCSLARSASAGEVGEFENGPEIYDNYLSGCSLDEDSLSYREEMTQSNSKKAVYTVRSGNLPIATVVLVPEEGTKHGFGRSEWKLGSVTASSVIGKLSSAEVRIFVHKGEGCLINGIPVGAEYLENKVEIPELSVYEKNLNLKADYDEYRIKGIFGDIRVETSGGKVLSCYDDGDFLVYFEYPDIMHDVHITAPEDAKVYVNGVELADGKLHKTEHTSSVSYDVLNLFNEPLVSAVDSKGNSLQPVFNNGTRYSFLRANDESVEKELSIWAREYFERYLKYSSGMYSAELQGKLLNRTQRHTELYNYILSSVDAMYWASATETQDEELEFGNFGMIDADTFSCSVCYKATTVSHQWKEDIVTEVNNAYELVFVKEGELWLCSEMNSVSE